MAPNIQAGFVQFYPQIGKLQENLEKLTVLIREGRNADVLVLPELANSGYNFQSWEEALSLAENLDRSPTLDLLTTLSARFNLMVVCGIHEEEEGKLFNTSVLVGPEGLIGKYRKVHLFWNEFDYFQPGDLGFPVFETDIGRIGMLICFDWVFPEAWRILALKGADLICHPSNLVLPYAQQVVPVHGLTNRVFTITANRYGEERGLKFSGSSFAASPEGEILLQAAPDKDSVQWCTMVLNQARNKQITPRNHLFNDRFPENYKPLTERDEPSGME